MTKVIANHRILQTFGSLQIEHIAGSTFELDDSEVVAATNAGHVRAANGATPSRPTRTKVVTALETK